jgi:hypothetical protein
MSGLLKDLPLTFTIPVPSYIPRARGLNATSGPLACFIQYRGVKGERERLAEAAACFGISSAEMHRWIVNQVADQVLKLKQEQLAKESPNGTDGTRDEPPASPGPGDDA